MLKKTFLFFSIQACDSNIPFFFETPITNMNSFDVFVSFLNASDLTRHDGFNIEIKYEFSDCSRYFGLMLILKKLFFRELTQNLIPYIFINSEY